MPPLTLKLVVETRIYVYYIGQVSLTEYLFSLHVFSGLQDSAQAESHFSIFTHIRSPALEFTAAICSHFLTLSRTYPPFYQGCLCCVEQVTTFLMLNLSAVKLRSHIFRCDDECGTSP